MTGWDNAVLEFEKNGTVKECPYCKRTNVKADKVFGKRRDSYWFSCGNCGQSAHYSGVLKQVEHG